MTYSRSAEARACVRFFDMLARLGGGAASRTDLREPDRPAALLAAGGDGGVGLDRVPALAADRERLWAQVLGLVN